MRSRMVVSSLAAVAAVAVWARQGSAQQHVTANLTASPASYSGPGPVTIKFLGTVSASKPGKLQYKFIRSDGAFAPVQTLDFAQAGTRSVSTTWTLGGPGFNYSGWEAIQVIYPQSMTSNRATFTVHCQAASLPDLVVSGVFLENGYKRAQVKNVGQAPATGAYVRFFVDGRSESTFGPVSLGVGQTAKATSTKLPSGTHKVKVIVDPENAIKESSDANNTLEVTLTNGAGGGQPIQEDLVSFNPAAAEVKRINGSWKIVDGDHWMFDFRDQKDEAELTLRIIKHYGMNQSGFVGRPDPSFTYMLASGQAPQGPFQDEDCIPFDPNTVEVKQIGGSWKIVDGNHWMFDFGAKESEARLSLAIIKKYGFNHSCFVGRPQASFVYLRK